MREFSPRAVFLLLAVVVVGAGAFAGEEGRDDLDKATQAKLVPARTVEELS